MPPGTGRIHCARTHDSIHLCLSRVPIRYANTENSQVKEVSPASICGPRRGNLIRDCTSRVLLPIITSNGRWVVVQFRKHTTHAIRQGNILFRGPLDNLGAVLFPPQRAPHNLSEGASNYGIPGIFPQLSEGLMGNSYHWLARKGGKYKIAEARVG